MDLVDYIQLQFYGRRVLPLSYQQTINLSFRRVCFPSCLYDWVYRRSTETHSHLSSWLMSMAFVVVGAGQTFTPICVRTPASVIYYSRSVTAPRKILTYMGTPIYVQWLQFPIERLRVVTRAASIRCVLSLFYYCLLNALLTFTAALPRVMAAKG